MKVRIGMPEIIFGVLLAIYMLLAFAGVGGLIRLFGKIVVSFLGLWIAIRISKQIVKDCLWRLRNRLIVAYFFIAVVPIVLITLLTGLGVMLAGGQVSVYLITSELDRRTAALRQSIDFLAHDTQEKIGSAENVGMFLQSRFPGVEMIVDGPRPSTFPEGGAVEAPSKDWPVGSGLMVRDGELFCWARSVYGSRSVFAMVPLTRELLGALAPDVGESTILNIDSNRLLLHRPVNALSSGVEPTRNRLPPAVNRFDFEIWWGAPLIAQVWNEPSRTETEWLNVRTRPSAVLRVVMAQKVDFANELIPMLFFGVAVLFLVAEAIALLIGISLTKTITGATHGLYEGTVRVMKGDFSHRIPIHGHDQLGELAVSFNQMTENVERLLAVEKERERLQAELEIAREVQNQLYPKRTPDAQTLTLTAVCNPARMVSGDYYDYQQIGANNVAIAIGDVAGKGISAALLMATVQSSFRSQIRGSCDESEAHERVSTSRLVSQLNKQLYADTSPEKYATFYLGVYDEMSSTLTYTNAGHLPPILIRDGAASQLEVNGMVVGAFPFAKYDESQLQIKPKDLLVFYTDGVTEPENAYGEMFGEQRLTELLVRNSHCQEQEIVAAVTDAVRQWTGTDELQDDMTLLLMRRH